jgi:hypothetical protein
MAKTNVSSDWDSSGNLVFSANTVNSSGSVVMNTGCPIILGTTAYQPIITNSLTTAANYTATVAQLLNGLTIDVAAGNYNVALPTVANVVAAIPGYKNGVSFKWIYRNAPTTASQAINVQADANTSWTLVGNCLVSANYAKTFLFQVTNATTGNCIALDAYSIAT